METALTFLLIRFAVIVGGLVILALVVFAVALNLKRRGRLDEARRRAEPLVREGVRVLAARAARKRGTRR
ncbi:hypothetical protein [Streptomyces griseocarneus]|uniref:hypothetical protein n=1 Tax=Streptomyces griseocarneus TaxID=51201 RepID=UPI00167DD7A4|nr:hypothetical protein [Streptomyces griseocarneus]MBZ6473663.1 hypothetical protein [Streptomyces griseocarneus]GHG64401.1 hypothetical protein GCM10018779_34290 [Streptomyces griseocarneus]